MKRMLTFWCCLLFFICAVSVACKKGDKGDPGNANAVQYTFGTQNLQTGFGTLVVSTTQDTMNNSAWFVYLHYQSLDRWYALPGQGVGGNTTYRVSLGYVGGKVNLYIDKNGPGEIYDQAKVVRIYLNNTLPGGRIEAGANQQGLPNIDFTDYLAVKHYYHLP